MSQMPSLTLEKRSSNQPTAPLRHHGGASLGARSVLASLGLVFMRSFGVRSTAAGAGSRESDASAHARGTGPACTAVLTRRRTDSR